MTDERLSYRQTFFLWLPLALSWLMMSVAGPVANAGISRLPDAAVNLAAHGLVMSIAVLVESPIIMILSTSVSAVRSKVSYLLLRRFVTHLTLMLTMVGLLVYFTPAYDVLFLRLMGVPPEVAEAARPALRVMLFWPAAIGWRRLYQGVLIRHGCSKLVSYGTVFRLVSLTATVALGVWLGVKPGALVGGLAMAVSVIVEMLVVRRWTLPVVHSEVLSVARDPSGSPPMSYGRLVRFYLPLAGTDAMRVLSQPLTSAGLARAANSTLSLAAWPVASGLAGLASSTIMALQEVVLARIRSEKDQQRLAWFSMATGLGLSGLLALVVFTPIASWYFGALLDVPPEVKLLALSNLVVLVPTPLLYAARNFQRGVLIWRRESSLVQLSMFINLLALAVLMAGGVYWGRVPGITVAAWATVASLVLEVVALWQLRRRAAASVAEVELSRAL